MLHKQADHSPIIRPATRDDFAELYALWMQAHINPFMSFELMTAEDFKPIFEKLFADSEIYVVEEAGKVVAARRMYFEKGEHAHVAGFASFGVDKDHLKKGYGKLFYEFFIDKLKREKPQITRVEISQETDNEPALQLARKQEFKVETVFPDWLIRTTGSHKTQWYVGERFLARMLDPGIKVKTQLIQRQPEFPALKQDRNEVKLEVKEDKACGFFKGKMQVTCDLSSGVRRYAHVQFWNLHFDAACEVLSAQRILRELAILSARKYKKVEIYTSDQYTLDVLAKLGFHMRGEKFASRKVGDEYYNEIGVDLSFFNIADAIKMMNTIHELEDYKRKQISSQLAACQSKIQEEFKAENIDEYARLYLENMAFQITREGLGVSHLHDAKNEPWSALLQQIPEKLKEVFLVLCKLVNINIQIPVCTDEVKKHYHF